MSSVVDEETVQTLDAGRETVFAMLKNAQTELKKIFLGFVVAFLGTVIAMRYYVWEFLRANTESRLSDVVAEDLDLVARTVFDVILMQVKLGLIVGTIVALILAVYLGRKAILNRVDASIPITKARLYAFVGTSLVLAIGGIVYAYAVFFPLMFKVLAEQAFQAGVKPTYGIVRYTEFLLLLTISFGLAAQIPLFVGALSYSEIVSYETFRDKWRYAVLGIFVFGAVFSPPDPFTQIMWAIPLLALYGFSLGIAKIVTNLRRARETGAAVTAGQYQRRLLIIVGGTLGAAVLTAGLLWADYGASLAARLPASISIPYLVTLSLPTGLLVAETPIAIAGSALQIGLLTGGVLVAVQLIAILREPVVPKPGSPDAVDLETMDAAHVRTAPTEVFRSLSEDEAVGIAHQSMEADPEKAQAILDRWEAVNEADASGAETDDADTPADVDDSDPVTDTAVGMMDAFTDEETDEDDIGGYLYDLQFIFDTLRSRAFILFGVFIGAFGGMFGYLYWRGIEDILRQFTMRVPNEQFRPGAGATDPTDIVVALHPVEVLIFIVKFSGLLAILVTLPLLLYYAWPAIQQRNLAPGTGDRRGFLLWGGLLMGTILSGAVFGFLVVAPVTISYLVSDAIGAGMVIAYRIRSLLWVVFFLTIGIGLFLAIPLSVVLLHYTSLVPYESMARRWRPIVFGFFVAGALFTPGGIITMFLLAIPTAVAFLLGLAILWLLTLPTRLRRQEPQAS